MSGRTPYASPWRSDRRYGGDYDLNLTFERNFVVGRYRGFLFHKKGPTLIQRGVSSEDGTAAFTRLKDMSATAECFVVLLDHGGSASKETAAVADGPDGSGLVFTKRTT